MAYAYPLDCLSVQDTELLPSTEDSSSLHVVVHRAFDVRSGSGSGAGAMRGGGGGAPTHSFADPLAAQTAAAPAAGSSLPSPGSPPLLSARFVFDDYIVRAGTTTRTFATWSYGVLFDLISWFKINLVNFIECPQCKLLQSSKAFV